MEPILLKIDPDWFLYGGAVGIFLGLLFFLFFIYRRIRWFFRLLSRKHTMSPRILSSMRNLLLIMFWTAFFGMALFLGFFLRSYHAFNYERPVAEIVTHPSTMDKVSRVTLTQFFHPDDLTSRDFFLRGDQWMVEGDIVKWDPWLNFLGLHTRYRLTRLRGRYMNTFEEVNAKKTIYSLVSQEENPLWQYLYEYGHRLPFVSTVYGNAAFQTSGEGRRYFIYVGTSGFIVRER
jgi:hypothetical protein